MESTEIVVILDRSGSMESIKTDVEGGFDAFIADQRTIDTPCYVTLTQFDSEGIEQVYLHKPLADVPKLTLRPRGSTPLLDAIGKTVTKVKETGWAGRTLVLIITDGQENASTTWTKNAVKQLLEERQGAGWAFIYLAANVDAFAEAGMIGVAAASTSSYAANSVGVANAFTSSSSKSKDYRSGGTVAFTQEERDQMENK